MFNVRSLFFLFYLNDVNSCKLIILTILKMRNEYVNGLVIIQCMYVCMYVYMYVCMYVCTMYVVMYVQGVPQKNAVLPFSQYIFKTA